MKHQKSIRLLAPALFACLSSVMLLAANGGGPDTPATTTQKAGQITALLPTAHVIRGAGKNTVTADAKKGDDLVWLDLIRTDKGGRARITLNDRSILSLGSQAELRIVKHDAQAQQTTLEMTYGRIRTQVENVTRNGGSFQLKTSTAVAGVIGTDFGTDASEPGVTTFVCISGLVQVGNADPRVPGSVPCAAGQTTTVKSGLPPTPPKPASPQQLQQIILDTEPATISAFAPASALVGTAVDAVANGAHFAGIDGVTVSGSGVKGALLANSTATSATAHLVVAGDATAGPHTVTFTKPNGASAAAVFTVIVPGVIQGTDAASLKKRYTDILDAELQAAQAADNATKSSLQQEIDADLQTIQQNNAKLPRPLPADQITQQLGNLLTGFGQSANLAERESQAYGTAASMIDAIVAQTEAKLGNGSQQASSLASDLDKQFAPVNATFRAALIKIHTDFADDASTQLARIEELAKGFEQTLTAAAQSQLGGPMPKTDSEEKTVEAGGQASFDASGSTPLPGTTIASTSWTLCDPSYRPGQVGVALPGDAPGCSAVAGYSSSSSEFQVNTCSLAPADYTARLTISDSNGRTSAMDVRLHVIPPSYDDPATRLRNWATAYTTLQQQQFLSYFDPSFAGYTQLQENVRNTFLSLSSMQINLRISQVSIACNDATLRADWEQIYTFRSDTTCSNLAPGESCKRVVFRQSEQLTTRMTRIPGRGWFISDLQGDNGTVQGVAPGPQTTFAAQPNLQVTNLTVNNQQPQNVVRTRGHIRAATSTPGPPIGLAAGKNSFTATVTNIGNAPLTQQPQLHISLLDGNNNELVGTTQNLATLPLKPGDSEMVTGEIIVPALPPDVPLSVSATVNPGCKVQEQICGSKDIAFLPATSGTAKLSITSVTPSGQLIGTQTGSFNVTVSNSGTATSLPSTIVLTSPDFPGVLANVTVPPVGPGQSLTISVAFSVPNSPGQHNVVVTVNQPSSSGGSSGGSITQPVNILQGNVDLQVGALSFTGGTPPFTAGESHTVAFNVSNNGDVPSNSADSFTCRLTNGTASAILGNGIIPVIAPGTTTASPIALTFTVPASTVSSNFAGQSNIVCVVSQDPLEAANQTADDSASISAFINAPAYVVGSIASANTPNPGTGGNAFQVGQNLDFQISVSNTGTASPTGNLIVQLDCAPSCSFSTQPSTATIAAPAQGTTTVANVLINSLNLSPAAGYTATASIVSAPAQSSTAGNSGTVAFDVTDFTLSNVSAINGDLNVKLGSTGVFNVNLSEPQGLTAVNIPVSVGPSVSSVNYTLSSPLSAGSTQPVVVTAGNSAPAGTSTAVTVTGTRFGVTRTAIQSVRFYTASLDNFSPGQPGNNPNIPIMVPIGGAPQSLQIRMTGNFSTPSGGAQLVFPTVTGLNFTPSATVAAPGDVITLQIAAAQGAAVNQTLPITITAQIPNTNPQDAVSLLFYVRSIALPDLAITAVSANGRNFTTNPWLSGEPLDLIATVSNNGQGASQGFEALHLRLNGVELTQRGATVPQAIAPNSSVNVTLHVDAPDPVASGAATLTVSVDEDASGDANPNNDSLSVSGVTTSDWNIEVTGAGSSDAQPLLVPVGSSVIAAILPTTSAGGNFFTPISLLNGVVSSRINATPSVGSITNNRPISYSIFATGTAADGFYVAQLIARFVDSGRNTAQRGATVHVQVANPNIPAAAIAVAVDRGNACSSGCVPVQINGLLIENENITVSRTGPMTADLHFTDSANIVSDVTQSGSYQTPIINGVQNGVPTNVYFAAAQDSSGAVLPGPASVIVSATSIQTTSKRDGPTPDPVGPNQTTLQFSVGDLQLGSVPCFNVAPGAEGVLTLNFTPVGGFNAPSISWSVAALPPGVVLNSVTPSSSLSGGAYSPVSIDLSNNNPADITPDQPLTLVGTIANANGTATVAFAPTIQLHAGACTPGGVRNSVIEGRTSTTGTRGVWKRGTSAAFVARSHVVRQQAAAADVRLVPGDVSYTPAMPKAGDTVQVRFRLSNNTAADAHGIPVALLINNQIVVTDTFDIPAGRTVLGGLQWANANLPRSADPNGPAVLMIDPARNAGAGAASGKIATLAHFSFTGGTSTTAQFQAGARQRARIKLTSSGCAGLSFTSGATSVCQGSDVEFALEDFASGRFSLASNRGIADIGAAYNGAAVSSATQFSSQAAAVIGHSYEVQLGAGKIGVLTLRGVSNPHQRAGIVNQRFRGGTAAKAAARLGGRTGPVETGDVSGAATPEQVVAVLDVLYDQP